MRAYFFGNMYLSPIQQGIQAAHVTAELFVKYPDVEWEAKGSPNQHLHDWAQNHKVMILLNAGYAENIVALNDFFSFTQDYDIDESPYPFTMFTESEAAMNGCVTSFGVILPAKIYNGAQAMRKLKGRRLDDPARMNFEYNKVLTVDCDDDKGPVDVAYTDWEVELMERLGTFRLA